MKIKADKIKHLAGISLIIILVFICASSVLASHLNVEKAFICEEIINREPAKKAVVFRNGIERIYCYTTMDKVRENTVIYHNWYKRDRLSSRIKLNAKSPRWATFSSIQLRDYDNGPWRVDITDVDGNILKVVRFSILD